MSLKQNLLTSAAVRPLSFGIFVGAVGLAAAVSWTPDRADASGALNPIAARHSGQSRVPATSAENPVAVTRMAAACNPCSPCAAKNPCNPCAAKNPCNPCAPGGAAMGATGCVVPSLQQASACNPCAAKKPAATCNPCAAKNPCNPCAAKNPCNPCGAKAPCNPCAAKAADNPCAAKNPCNPCAAANPCNPCAASAEQVTVPDDEMQALYDCLKPLMLKAYRPGGHFASGQWGDWELFSTRSYVSDTHGGRFVQNAANDLAAEEYGKHEDAGRMPIGSILAKPSFTVAPDGQASIGPLFLMEKMTRNWNGETADWRYAMIMADGSTFGVTGGPNSDGMKFCHECHTAGQDADYMLFMPEEFRRQ